MQKLTGRLKSKSLIKEGETKKGKWRIIQFVIERTYRKKPLKIPFIAKGKLAEFVHEIPIDERIVVDYLPKSTLYNNKWYTELVAIEVNKYVRRPHDRIVVNGDLLDDDEFHIKPDLQLFKTE